MGDEPVAKPLLTHDNTHTDKKHEQISMPLVGFEPTMLLFNRAKMFHALDRAAAVNVPWILK
jgi:hypothetical protein